MASPVDVPVMSQTSFGSHDVSDELLLSAMASGDEQAALAFVRRYQRRLYGLAMVIVQDAALAEDVAQEALIRIFRHAAVFDARRGSVSAWVLAITRNLAIDLVRVRRANPIEPNDPVFHRLMAPEQPPEDAAIEQDILGRLRAPLAALPASQRRAVVLAAMYGWSAREIAEFEGVPLGTAKGRIRLGMATLRNATAEEAQ
jgi:RNA polymerase sigma factor (sigma-70 family)